MSSRLCDWTNFCTFLTTDKASITMLPVCCGTQCSRRWSLWTWFYLRDSDMTEFFFSTHFLQHERGC